MIRKMKIQIWQLLLFSKGHTVLQYKSTKDKWKTKQANFFAREFYLIVAQSKNIRELSSLTFLLTVVLRHTLFKKKI